jgi:sugar phosphate isomerase/epimerase
MPLITLSTGSLYTYGIARAFELAAKAGFEAIEVLADHRWDSRHPAYLRRLSADTGLPVAAVHNPFKQHVPGWPSGSLDRLRETVALAREVGAPVVVAHLPLRVRGLKLEFFGFQRAPIVLNIPWGGQIAYRDFLLNGLARFEEEEGVKIGIENMPRRYVLGRKANIYWLNEPRALAQLPHLTLDTTHIGTWGYDLLAIYEQLKTRIVHVHLSNFDGREHQLPADGQLPLDQFLHRLALDGYQGAVSAEVNPDALQAEDEAQILAQLRRVVSFCREHMAC